MGNVFNFVEQKKHKGAGKIPHGSGDTDANGGAEHAKATLENGWLKSEK